MDEETTLALGRVSFLIGILHVAGSIQMYVLIVGLLTGNIVSILLGVGFVLWFSNTAAQYQWKKRKILESVEKDNPKDDD